MTSLFTFKKPSFQLLTAGKAAEAAAADHPVAGDNERQGVSVTGPADGPGLAGIAQFLGYVAIGSGGTIWDLAYEAPDPLLERCALVDKRGVGREGGCLALQDLQEKGLDIQPLSRVERSAGE